MASKMQEDFCEYLGLKVVGTVARPEDVTPQEYRKLLRLKARFVIGNLQEVTTSSGISENGQRSTS